MNTTEINSISDLLQIVEHLKQINPEKRYFKKGCDGPPWYKYKHNLWFRGQDNYDWELKPQTERANFCKVSEKAQSLPLSYETSILKQFIIQASHLLPTSLTKTDRYFLAQHYGLPTRLLDWSINPLVALFFAVSSNAEEDGSVFCFYSRGDIYGHEEYDVVNQQDSKVTHLIDKLFDGSIESEFEDKKLYPLRIVPNSQEGRIIRQGSRFTLHYPDGCNLDLQLNNILFKYKIPQKSKEALIRELRLLGVNWASLFPDMEYLVKDIKQQANLL